MTGIAAEPRTAAYGRPLLLIAAEIGVHVATMHRWRDRGVLGLDGVRRHLRMIRIGGRWYVRDADVSDFLAALGGDSDGI